MEAYEAMPVEAFGEALLRGMGWSEGRAVGRNVKEEVKAKDLVRRPHRLGLGAAPAPEAPSKKKIKPGETPAGTSVLLGYMERMQHLFLHVWTRVPCQRYHLHS